MYLSSLCHALRSCCSFLTSSALFETVGLDDARAAAAAAATATAFTYLAVFLLAPTLLPPTAALSAALAATPATGVK